MTNTADFSSSHAGGGVGLELALLMPDREVWRGPVHMVVVPGVQGDLGVLARHIPLVSRLRDGESVVLFDRQMKPESGFFVDNGFVEITAARVVVFGHYIERYGERSMADIQHSLQEAGDSDTAPALRSMIEASKNLPYGLVPKFANAG